MIRSKFLSILLIFLLIGNAVGTTVLAEVNLEITGNSASSQNEIEIQITQQNSETQSNQSHIQNIVITESNTGTNNASDNTGESTISTGDTTTKISIESASNSNSVTIDACCSPSSASSISNNGDSTINTIDQAVTTSTTSSSSNNAEITNEVSITANTGHNTTSGNSSDVVIHTGNVKMDIGVGNTANSAQAFFAADLPTPTSQEFISGNGANSINSITSRFSKGTTSDILNFTRVSNKFHLEANTGHNAANANSGKVGITSGDIFANLKLFNKSNQTQISILPTCCDPTPTVTPPVAPSITPTSTPSPTPGPIGGISTPTQAPSAPSGGQATTSPSSDSMLASSPTVPGQILGLSATGDQLEILSNLFYIASLVCLASSSKNLFHRAPKRRRK